MFAQCWGHRLRLWLNIKPKLGHISGKAGDLHHMPLFLYIQNIMMGLLL